MISEGIIELPNGMHIAASLLSYLLDADIVFDAGDFDDANIFNVNDSVTEPGANQTFKSTSVADDFPESSGTGGQKELRELGTDPVIKDGNETAIFDQKNHVKLLDSLEAVLRKAGFTEVQIAEARAEIGDALRNGQASGSFQRFTLPDGTVITMGNGGPHYSADIFKSALGADGVGWKGVFDIDGKKVEIMFFDKCGNPALLPETPTSPVTLVPSPLEPTCGPEVQRTHYVGGEVVNPDGSPLRGIDRYLVIGEGEEVYRVRVTGLPADGLLKDLNGDGNYVRSDSTSRLGISFDRGEVLTGITQAQIDADVAAARASGFKGQFLVYEAYDCNGRSVVACWDTEKGCWSFVHPTDKGGALLKGSDGKVIIFDTPAELRSYLNQ